VYKHRPYVRQHTEGHETVPGHNHRRPPPTRAVHRARPQRTVFSSPYARQRTEKRLGNAHNAFVQIRADKAPSLLPWITTTATTLASMAGFAVLMAWMPLLLGASRDTLPTSQIEDATPDATIDAGTQPLEGLARRNVKCAECGLIESIRETERDSETIAPAKSAGREITVRLQDGSSRVMIDTNPGRLRLGERVKVIDGLAGSGA
jgi:hypothetical protein